MKQILASVLLYLSFIIPAGAQTILYPTDSLTTNVLEEVVITGQFEPQSVKNSVFRVRTISSEQIALRGSTTVENVLNSQLGIRFSNDLTLGESDIQLMGMSGQNVKVLVDGIPLIDRGAAKQSLSQVDVNNISRIELVEGPMSVIYGTDALAGVINIITKKGQGGNHFGISGRIQEESAGNEYQTFKNEGTHNGNLTFEWQQARWQARLSGSRNNFGGWKGNSAGRTLAWNPKNQWLAAASVGYRTENASVYYRTDFLDEDIYTPGPLNESNLRAVDKNYLTRRLNHVLQSEWRINEKIGISGALSYQDYERNTRTRRHDFRNGTSELTTGNGEQDRASFTSTLVRATLQYKLSESVHLQPGFDIQRNNGAGERISGNPSIHDYAFFISSEVKVREGITLRPGLRFIENSVYDAPPVIPSLNTKISLGHSFDLRAAYARGFRSPALRELYFTFFDANHSIQGNETLKAEYSNSFNSFLTWYGPKTSALTFKSTIGGFYNQFNNLITIGTLPGNASANTYINIDKFRTAGGTLENRLAWRSFSGSLGISYIGRYNQLSDSEKNVPGMVWSPELSSDILFSIPEWNAGINFFYKFNGKRPGYEVSTQTGGEPAIQRTQIQSYHLADLTINKKISSYASLIGGIRNLFDVTQIDNSATGSGEAHSDATGQIPISYGRSYFLGLTFQWSKN